MSNMEIVMARTTMRNPDAGDQVKRWRVAAVRKVKPSKGLAAGNSRFAAVMQAAEHSGLLGEKSMRIGGRISPALIEQAKKQTGIETDTDLIEFALASVALDDDFGQTFRKTRGTVDPALKLGF